MSRVKVVGSVLDGRSGRVLLALLLAGTLLLCHGFYGASHQAYSATPHAEHSSYAHGPHTDTHGAGVREQPPVEHQSGDGEGHLGHVAYAAALLVISLGTALWLLSGGRTWTRGGLPTFSKPVVPLIILRPPPRPSPALLQVFRQ